MTQTPFDQMSKQYLEEMLSPFGIVQRQYEVPGEAKFIDVWFVPQGNPHAAAELGLLGRMLEGPCLFEPYRNIPARRDLRVGTMKLIWVQEDERRKAKVDELPEEALPRLWILAAQISRPLLETFRLRPDPQWPDGVYFAGDGYRTGLVAIDQLPETEETLWLRVLGRGETQKRAVEAVMALPQSAPRRAQVLQLVFSWRVRIDLGELAAEFADGEELMALSEAYVAWETELKEKSREEGAQRTASAIVLNMLHDNLPLAQIARLTGLTIAQIQQLQAENP
jgi:hypothetical protein